MSAPSPGARVFSRDGNYPTGMEKVSRDSITFMYFVVYHESLRTTDRVGADPGTTYRTAVVVGVPLPFDGSSGGESRNAEHGQLSQHDTF
jgi:hypothetical protein